MASNNNENKYLKELGKSNFKVAKGDSDIRGWVVKNVHGRVVGVVDDLVIDTQAEKVKYVVVDLATNELQLRDRKVILPIDLAKLDVAFKNVVYPAEMPNELATLPSHEKGRFYIQTDELISRAFAPYYHQGEKSSSAGGRSLYEGQTRTEAHGHPSPSPQPTDRSNAMGSANTPRTESQMPPQEHPIGYASQATSGGSGREERPQTVVGIFDHTNQAQAAVEYLVKNGFARENIEIMLRDADDYDTTRKGENDSGISDFFTSLFHGDNRAHDYSDAATTCSVVTLHTRSLGDAERAAEILDNHGAVNVEERYHRQSAATGASAGQSRRFQSLIVEKPDDGRVRGLR